MALNLDNFDGNRNQCRQINERNQAPAEEQFEHLDFGTTADLLGLLHSEATTPFKLFSRDNFRAVDGNHDFAQEDADFR